MTKKIINYLGSSRTRKSLFLSFSFLTIIFFIYSSCKKKDKCDGVQCQSGLTCVDGTCSCVAGAGGAVEIAAFPVHHVLPILNHANYLDTAYVKFNTQDYPGPKASDYDLVIAGEVGEDHVHIPNLKCGDYYIYMTGFDTTINMRVTGGIPYSFTQTMGTIDVIVPVTE